MTLKQFQVFLASEQMVQLSNILIKEKAFSLFISPRKIKRKPIAVI
jgi:hypothetical protein